jgi:FlaA1/EpsC-like NDP-sugar epimerase
VLEIPGAHSWFNGRFQLDQLKKIDLNDLLGRESIKLDLELIDEGLRGKIILVTGAAGSIGSEMVRQFSRFDVKEADSCRSGRNADVSPGERVKQYLVITLRQ